ncbi:MAG TPA: SDR family NAD(P)-dependent oxidoreductase [Sphingomicrobium sp.]|nr:SDR family NAD(P)-dependent oxidoreductase [Sphingomicrobium sp.]
MELTGRTVLITGGTSGIGLETAAPLLARDNVVIVTGREDKGIDAAKLLHGKAIGDVSHN